MNRQKVLVLLVSSVVLLGGTVVLKNVRAQKEKTSTPVRFNVGLGANPVVDPEQNAKDQRQGALHNEALKLLAKSEWKSAQLKLQEAIAVDPGSAIPPLYADLATALNAQGHSREALAAMRQAFFGKSTGMENHPDTLIRYAAIAEKVGEKQEAYRAYLQATVVGSAVNSDFAGNVPQNPTQAQVKALAHVAAGQEKHRMSNDKAAEASFRQALTIDPKCALAHLNLATVLPHNEEALTHFNQAAKLGSPAIRQFSRLKAEDIAAQVRQKSK
jgi:tetratricopeptide (TPR) repeat protein